MSKTKLLIAAAVVVTLSIAACGGGSASSSRQAAGGQAAGGGTAQGGARRFAAIAVQAVTVQAAALVTDNNTAGTVVPVMQSQVAAQASGVVVKVIHRVGEHVAEGTPVIQLDDTALKLAAQNAQAALDNARINLSMGQQNTAASNPKLVDQLQAAQGAMTAAQKTYDSQKALFDLGGISSSQLDNAKSVLDQAQANVEAAKAALDQNAQSETQNIAQLKLAVDQATNQLALAQFNLRNATIRAPFAGQIAALNVSPGSFVGVNASAFMIVSAEKQINFTEPPTDAPNFHIGDVVSFNVGGKSYPVKIMQAPSAPINGVVPMVASVPASLPLAYGTVGTVGYKLTVATGPQIPIAALLSRSNANYVYTVVNGKANEQAVTILAEAGTTAVVQGIGTGDQVIISPPPGLVAGSTVQLVALPAGQGQNAAAEQATQGQGRSEQQGGGQPAGGQQGGGQQGRQRTGGQQSGRTGNASGPGGNP